MPGIVLVFLFVSCLSWVFQAAAFVRLSARRGRTAEMRKVSNGYRRTAGCRVMAATAYVVVAAVQVAGDGTLTFESLTVWIGVQILWWLNALADIRIRRSLSPTERPRHALR
jgi:hypothetical protein